MDTKFTAVKLFCVTYILLYKLSAAINGQLLAIILNRWLYQLMFSNYANRSKANFSIMCCKSKLAYVGGRWLDFGRAAVESVSILLQPSWI